VAGDVAASASGWFPLCSRAMRRRPCGRWGPCWGGGGVSGRRGVGHRSAPSGARKMPERAWRCSSLSVTRPRV